MDILPDDPLWLWGVRGGIVLDNICWRLLLHDDDDDDFVDLFVVVLLLFMSMRSCRVVGSILFLIFSVSELSVLMFCLVDDIRILMAVLFLS